MHFRVTVNCSEEKEGKGKNGTDMRSGSRETVVQKNKSGCHRAKDKKKQKEKPKKKRKKMKKIGMGSRAPNGDGGYDVVAGDERHARQHLPGSTQPRVSSILVRVGAFEWGAVR